MVNYKRNDLKLVFEPFIKVNVSKTNKSENDLSNLAELSIKNLNISKSVENPVMKDS